jgi:predicted alpha/beta superfamily hydrolase
MQPTDTTPAFVSTSPETGTSYRIYVDAPAAPDGAAPWPCVLLMDGDYFFDAAVAASRELRSTGQIGPAVLIGVGYGAGFGQPGNERGRDYTPTASALEPASGGAGTFLHYLTGTLWPQLTSRYPLQPEPEARMIAGHSLGSLFALYALLQDPPFFGGVLASAPSLWWDDRSLLQLAHRLRDRRSSLPAHLFLGVGADDSPSMTGDLALLEQQLADRPFADLHVTSDRFPGRDHLTVLPDTLRAGFRALLG